MLACSPVEGTCTPLEEGVFYTLGTYTIYQRCSCQVVITTLNPFPPFLKDNDYVIHARQWHLCLNYERDGSADQQLAAIKLTKGLTSKWAPSDQRAVLLDNTRNGFHQLIASTTPAACYKLYFTISSFSLLISSLSRFSIFNLSSVGRFNFK